MEAMNVEPDPRRERASWWWNGDVMESRALGRFGVSSWRIWWLTPATVLVWWLSYVTSTPTWGTQDRALNGLQRSLHTVAQQMHNDVVNLLPGFALGDTSLLSADMVDAMRNSGLAHLTAVSGANCIIPMTTAAVVSSWLGLPWRARICSEIVALALFAWAVWPQETVLRASLMLGVVLVLRMLGRGAIAVPVLCGVVITCLLVNPSLAHSLSFALSVSATLGIVTLSAELESVCSRWCTPGLAQGIAVTTSALVATIPLQLLMDQSPALVALPANVLAAPAALWAAWWSTLAAPVAGCAPVATMMLWIAQPGAWIVAQLAIWGNNHPIAELAWPQGLVGVVSAAAVVALLIGSSWSTGRLRRFVRWIALAMTCVVISITVTMSIAKAARIPSNWDLVMCDVGQGDGLVVRSDEGVAVSDGGPDPDRMLECLRNLGVRALDLIVISHFDHDHIGGLTTIIRALPVRAVAIPAVSDTRDEARRILRLLDDRGIHVLRMSVGQQLPWGAGTLTALAPSADQTNIGTKTSSAQAEAMNDVGLVLHWVLPNRCDLVTLADLSERAQLPLISAAPNVDVVKVAHHGSKDFSSALVENLRASVAMIGVGKNSYGHPTAQAIAAWQLSGAAVFRTDTDGDIAVSCAADKIEVNTTR